MTPRGSRINPHKNKLRQVIYLDWNKLMSTQGRTETESPIVSRKTGSLYSKYIVFNVEDSFP